MRPFFLTRASRQGMWRGLDALMRPRAPRFTPAARSSGYSPALCAQLTPRQLRHLLTGTLSFSATPAQDFEGLAGVSGALGTTRQPCT